MTLDHGQIQNELVLVYHCVPPNKVVQLIKMLACCTEMKEIYLYVISKNERSMPLSQVNIK